MSNNGFVEAAVLLHKDTWPTIWLFSSCYCHILYLQASILQIWSGRHYYRLSEDVIICVLFYCPVCPALWVQCCALVQLHLQTLGNMKYIQSRKQTVNTCVFTIIYTF